MADEILTVEPTEEEQSNRVEQRLRSLNSDKAKAEKLAEESAKAVKGKVFHREDIGTKELIEKRIKHMKELI